MVNLVQSLSFYLTLHSNSYPPPSPTLAPLPEIIVYYRFSVFFSSGDVAPCVLLREDASKSWIRKFPMEISFGNCRVPREFPNGIVGQLSCHLISDRNFRIFWPNGICKHPKTKANHSRQLQNTNNAMKRSELEANTGKA